MKVTTLRLRRTSGKHRATGIAVTRAYAAGFEPRHCAGVTATGSDCIAHDHPAAVSEPQVVEIGGAA